MSFIGYKFVSNLYFIIYICIQFVFRKHYAILVTVRFMSRPYTIKISKQLLAD